MLKNPKIERMTFDNSHQNAPSKELQWFEKGEFRKSDLAYALSPEFLRLIGLLSSEGLLDDVVKEAHLKRARGEYKNATTLLLCLLWTRLRESFRRFFR